MKQFRSLTICTPHTHYSGNQIEKNEVEGVCSTYWGQERGIQGFGGKI